MKVIKNSILFFIWLAGLWGLIPIHAVLIGWHAYMGKLTTGLLGIGWSILIIAMISWVMETKEEPNDES